MYKKYYLRIDGGHFGFLVEDIHTIKETDIKITQEEYDEFFKLQSEGKQFKLKEIATGIGLFDYLEEYTPEVVVDTTPSMEDRMKAVEMAMLEMAMKGEW